MSCKLPKWWNSPITKYWLKNYIGGSPCGCLLCGTKGVIDSRDVTGCINFCICPNGQALRRAGVDPSDRFIPGRRKTKR